MKLNEKLKGHINATGDTEEAHGQVEEADSEEATVAVIKAGTIKGTKETNIKQMDPHLSSQTHAVRLNS